MEKRKFKFQKDLRQQVDAYFNSRDIRDRKQGGIQVWINLVIALCMYVIPFMIFCWLGSGLEWWGVMLLGIVMALGFNMVGANQHHGGHQSFHKSKRVNSAVAWLIHLLGLSRSNWHRQHNVAHHTYPNTYAPKDTLGKKYDPDTSSGEPALIFSVHSKVKHALKRYQHLLTPFAYGLTFVIWIIFGDFRRVRIYYKNGLYNNKKYSYRVLLQQVLWGKLAYFAVFFGVPVVVFGISFGSVFLLWITCVVCAGWFMMPIFQLAHINEWTTDFDASDLSKNMPSFYERQLLTTVDFFVGKNHRSWLNQYFFHPFEGGLGYQVVHHLFPGINYAFYPDISDIVEKVAKMHGIPYHRVHLLAAVRSHWDHMKRVGGLEAVSSHEV